MAILKLGNSNSSFSGSFSGSYQGDGSQLTNLPMGTSASYAATASYVETAQTASYVHSSSIDNITDYVRNDQTSSMTVLSSSFALTSSYVETAQTASYVLNAVSSSYALTASYAVSASHEIIKEVSSSYADTASFAQSGDGIFSGSFSGSYVGNGSGLTNLTIVTNRFGISNGSGSFTYYSDLSSSAAATVSGDVIQMFADFEETLDVNVEIKDGVTLDGNGYTYTLNTAGTSTALTFTSVASTTHYLTNIRIVRTGGIFSSTTSGCILIGASNFNKKLYGDGVRLENSSGTCLISTGAGSRFDEVTGITGTGVQGAYWM